MTGLTFEERNALAILRKAMMRKPEIATLLMKDMSKGVASSVLVQAGKELDMLLKVSQAFSAAAGALVSIDTPKGSS